MPMMHVLAEQGTAIRIARTVVGRTREQLAERAGVKCTRLAAVERGFAQATADELARLWGALAEDGRVRRRQT